MKKVLALFLSATLGLAACQSSGTVTPPPATMVVTPAPTPAPAPIVAVPQQAKTLAEAINLDSLAVRTTTQVIRAVKLPPATLLQIEKYRDLVHAALVSWEQSSMAGQSAAQAAFNVAFATFVNYNSSKGIATQ